MLLCQLFSRFFFFKKMDGIKREKVMVKGREREKKARGGYLITSVFSHALIRD